MVTRQSIDEQLKKINFNISGWGRTEIKELPNIILPDEKIFECVNGIYEGGFALLVGTNIRVILIDKKPLNYLTVEDLRFDMINEIDYSHRLFGARINISTGSKTLRFTTINQQRLRKLISEVQNHMAEAKLKQSEHQEGQRSHLEQINQQLQAYLLAQHQQQQKIQEQLSKAGGGDMKQALADIEPVRPTPELADYLYARSLLAGQGDKTEAIQMHEPAKRWNETSRPAGYQAAAVPVLPTERPAADELYEEGVREVFGKQHQPRAGAQPITGTTSQQLSASGGFPLTAPLQMTTNAIHHALEINPLRVAHSRLPMAMRNRRFGRPSFHSHSQSGAGDSVSPRHHGAVPAHY